MAAKANKLIDDFEAKGYNTNRTKSRHMKNLNNFCGGCNNTVILNRFVMVDEGQDFRVAWEMKHDMENDKLFKRTRFMAFCLCGNIFIKP